MNVGVAIALDAGGNMYVTGYFDDTVDFGSGPITCVGGVDAFLTKLVP